MSTNRCFSKITFPQGNKQLKESKTTSSLIETLQSFGIIVKTKVNYCKRKDNWEEQLKESHMAGLNRIQIVEGINEGLADNVQPTIDYSNRIYPKESRILIRFKCDFDHLSVIKNQQNFNGDEPNIRKERFNNLIKTDRKQANVIRIEFDLKFESITEIVNYLNMSNPKIELENELLSRLVEILDIDQDKKQVFIKLKSIDSSKTNLSSFLLLGKIDGSNTCFMLDFTLIRRYNIHISTIDQIYRYFTPQKLKGRIYSKGAPNTFHDCKDIGVYRVLIGCFFVSTTDNRAGNYNKREIVKPINNTNAPEVLDAKTNNYFIFAQQTSKYDYFYYDHNYYGGIIDTGFYKFELKSECRFYCNFHTLNFRSEYFHFTL